MTSGPAWHCRQLPEGLCLVPTEGSTGCVRVEFDAGRALYRIKSGAQRELLSKAVGVSPKRKLVVIDATAGLGRDAFILAAAGCEVTLLERSDVLVRMIEDGFYRARQAGDPALEAILSRMTLQHVDAVKYMSGLAVAPDVIYLDPMFPDRKKRAAVKKEMQALQALIGHDDDGAELLSAALALARYRVVVKRPRLAPVLGGVEPAYNLTGRSSRFDVYILAAFP